MIKSLVIYGVNRRQYWSRSSWRQVGQQHDVGFALAHCRVDRFSIRRPRDSPRNERGLVTEIRHRSQTAVVSCHRPHVRGRSVCQPYHEELSIRREYRLHEQRRRQARAREPGQHFVWTVVRLGHVDFHIRETVHTRQGYDVVERSVCRDGRSAAIRLDWPEVGRFRQTR